MANVVKLIKKRRLQNINFNIKLFFEFKSSSFSGDNQESKWNFYYVQSSAIIKLLDINECELRRITILQTTYRQEIFMVVFGKNNALIVAYNYYCYLFKTIKL